MLIKNSRRNGTHITNREGGLALATSPVMITSSNPYDLTFGPDDERTGPQLYGNISALASNELWNVSQAYYNEYRAMRSDPTIAFARMLCVAPLVTAGWSYEADDDAPEGAKDFIEKTMEQHRIDIMKAAVEGYIDFGWAPFELVYAPTDDGAITLEKVKKLLQDYTQILVDKRNGDWIGYRQFIFKPDAAQADLPFIDLYVNEALHVVIDYEGTDWYGRALSENVRGVYNKAQDVEAAATRYDLKVAGAHWVIHYPIGTSPVNGVDKDNAEIADEMLGALKASGGFAVPRKIAQFADEMNSSLSRAEDVWKVEILAAPTTGTQSFIDRLKYFDVMKIRGYGIPERAVTEGQFGTKAESETQSDFAITNFEMRHIVICEWVNFCATDNLLVLNYGPKAKGKVRVVPTPLTDSKKSFWQTLYSQLLFAPEVMPVELPNIDLAAMRKQIGLPETKNSDPDTDSQLLADAFAQSQADSMAQRDQQTAGASTSNDENWFQ